MGLVVVIAEITVVEAAVVAVIVCSIAMIVGEVS